MKEARDVTGVKQWEVQRQKRYDVARPFSALYTIKHSFAQKANVVSEDVV